MNQIPKPHIALYALYALYALIIPSVMGACLTSTETLQINNLEQQLNISTNSMVVIFEDMCSRHATNSRLDLTESSINSKIDGVNNNITTRIDNEINTINNNWTTSFNEHITTTENTINKTVTEEMDQYLERLEVSSRLMDIILILNRSHTWETWKEEMDTNNAMFVDNIDEKITDMRSKFATKEYVDEQVTNSSYYQYSNQNETDYRLYIVLGFVIVIVLFVVYTKSMNKNRPMKPMSEVPSHVTDFLKGSGLQRDIKELQLKQQESELDIKEPKKKGVKGDKE